MICSYCGKENEPTAVFCLRCRRLLEVRNTSNLPKTAVWGHRPATKPPEETPVPPKPYTHTAHIGKLSQGRVALYFGMTSDVHIIDLHDHCYLGRVPGDPTLQRVDLSPYAALEKGVSRVHGSLAWKDDVVVVEDLKSSNGTWVNSVRLLPNEPRPLENGDLILLGKFDLWVYYR
jgi:hypothetical protein